MTLPRQFNISYLSIPGTAPQRKSYRTFLYRYNIKFSFGRKVWPSELVDHFNWWLNRRIGNEPIVKWEKITTSPRPKDSILKQGYHIT